MGESKVGERHMRFLEVLDEVALGDIYRGGGPRSKHGKTGPRGDLAHGGREKQDTSVLGVLNQS